MSAALDALAEAVGPAVSTGQADLDRVRSDRSGWTTPETPIAVVRARSAEDVQAVLRIATEFRVPVVLCDIEGLTYEEIGATLGIKLGTVRSRIHRGRVQLREALAHLAPRRPAFGGGA